MNSLTPTTGYAPVNGLQLYHETYGTGRPLVLLHGGFGVVGMFNALLSELAQAYQVIGVELQGHGHTADIDRPMSYEAFGDDVAALIRHLGHEKADVVGFSMGGGAALQTAIRHPEVVNRLVIISAGMSAAGWFDEGRPSGEMEPADLEGTIMHEAYLSTAPRPDDWPRFVRKMGEFMTSGDGYDWSEGVAGIKSPTLIVIGDNDFIRPAHAVEMLELLGGGRGKSMSEPPPTSQLAILPGTTHFDILDRADLLLPILLPFLNGPTEPIGFGNP